MNSKQKWWLTLAVASLGICLLGIAYAAVDFPLAWTAVTTDTNDAPLPEGTVWYDVYGYPKGGTPVLKATTDKLTFVRQNVGNAVTCSYVIARFVPLHPDGTKWAPSDPSNVSCNLTLQPKAPQLQ